MDFSIKRFYCPIHTSQPIRSMSKDPAATGGLLYCHNCITSLSLSQQDHLISIEDFLFDFFTDFTSSEHAKFSCAPPKGVQTTLARLERLTDLFTANSLIEKSTAIERLSRLEGEFLELIKSAKESIAGDFDSKVRFLKQRLDTYRLTVARHFEFNGKGIEVVVPPLNLQKLFEEVNKSRSVPELKQTLISRLCDLKQIRDKMVINKRPLQGTVEGYLNELADEIETMAKRFPTNFLCNEEYFQVSYEKIMKCITMELGKALEPESRRGLTSMERLWRSNLVSRKQFERVQEQLWSDREEEFYLIRAAERGGSDLEEAIRVYEVMEDSLMVLRDSKERLIFCFKRGRSLRKKHKNMTIMLLKSGECLKLDAEDTPTDYGKRCYLTKDICLVPKDRVVKSIDEAIRENQQCSEVLDRALCFGIQKIDTVSSEKMVIMEAELFGVRVR